MRITRAVHNLTERDAGPDLSESRCGFIYVHADELLWTVPGRER
jgi:hypothetical protein